MYSSLALSAPGQSHLSRVGTSRSRIRAAPFGVALVPQVAVATLLWRMMDRTKGASITEGIELPDVSCLRKTFRTINNLEFNTIPRDQGAMPSRADRRVMDEDLMAVVIDDEAVPSGVVEELDGALVKGLLLVTV